MQLVEISNRYCWHYTYLY